MLPQVDNRTISALLLAIDNAVLTQGQAYINSSSLFYPAISNIQGLSCYTSPYKPFVNDISIPGANVMSGVYLNGNYITVGQSGLQFINHYNGALYFNQVLPKQTIISGNFAIKEFSVTLTDKPDYKILFESKFVPNPMYTNIAPISGLSIEDQVAPAIFLVVKSQQQKPFSFAGVDDNQVRMRAVIVAESIFQKIAVCNILKNFRLKPLLVPAIGQFPLDYLGNWTGLNYNYTGMVSSSYYAPIILRAITIEMPEQGEYFDMKKNFAIVDMDVSLWAGHA